MKDNEAHERDETRELRIAYEGAKIENARLREAFYLPMDCPSCGRQRLLVSPDTKSVECEKCFTSAWDCDAELHGVGGPHPQWRATKGE